jgi:hypothetical protein
MKKNYRIVSISCFKGRFVGCIVAMARENRLGEVRWKYYEPGESSARRLSEVVWNKLPDSRWIFRPSLATAPGWVFRRSRGPTVFEVYENDWI